MTFTVKADLRCPHTSHIVKTITSRAFAQYTGRTVYLRFTPGLPTIFATSARDGRTESRLYDTVYGNVEKFDDGRLAVSSRSEREAVVSHTSDGLHGGPGNITISIQAPLDLDAFQVVVDTRLADPLENGTPRRCGSWILTLAELTPGESWGNARIDSRSESFLIRPNVTRRDLVMAAVEGRVTELAREQAKLERDFADREAEDHARRMNIASELGLPNMRRLESICRGDYRRMTGRPFGMSGLERLGLVREIEHRDNGLGATFSYVPTTAGRIVAHRIRVAALPCLERPGDPGPEQWSG